MSTLFVFLTTFHFYSLHLNIQYLYHLLHGYLKNQLKYTKYLLLVTSQLYFSQCPLHKYLYISVFCTVSVCGVIVATCLNLAVPTANSTDIYCYVILDEWIQFKQFTVCPVLKLSCIFFVLPTTAKPIHHHGQDCLRLQVDVAGRKSPSKNHHEKSKEEHGGRSADGGKTMSSGSGGVHNPSNRLPAGEQFISSSFIVAASESFNWVCLRRSHGDEIQPWLLSCPCPHRWPCCDGAKCSEEHRKLGTAAAFLLALLLTLLQPDGCFISADATLRLMPTTETMLNAGHWGPWTLNRDFINIYMYMNTCSLFGLFGWFFFYQHGQWCQCVF